MKWLNLVAVVNIIYIFTLYFLPTVYQVILYGCQFPIIAILYCYLLWQHINNMRYQPMYVALAVCDIIISFLLIGAMAFSYSYLM